jgi:hypothetical protein
MGIKSTRGIKVLNVIHRIIRASSLENKVSHLQNDYFESSFPLMKKAFFMPCDQRVEGLSEGEGLRMANFWISVRTTG